MGSHTSLAVASTQVLSLTTASTQSTVIGAASTPSNQEIVRLASTADVWITVGSNPTAIAANAASFLLPAGTVEYMDVLGGNKIAGITATGTAILSVAVCLVE